MVDLQAGIGGFNPRRRRELAVVLGRGKNPADGFIDDLGYQESSLVVGVMVVGEVVSTLF